MRERERWDNMKPTYNVASSDRRSLIFNSSQPQSINHCWSSLDQMRLKNCKSRHISLVTMIYTLILINYRKFPFKIIVFASGVHLNIFIESHYMNQTAIIFLTNSDYQANEDCYLETKAKKKSFNKWLSNGNLSVLVTVTPIPNTTIDIFMFFSTKSVTSLNLTSSFTFPSPYF